jgi:hypothetical protein
MGAADEEGTQEGRLENKRAHLKDTIVHGSPPHLSVASEGDASNGARSMECDDEDDVEKADDFLWRSLWATSWIS